MAITTLLDRIRFIFFIESSQHVMSSSSSSSSSSLNITFAIVIRIQSSTFVIDPIKIDEITLRAIKKKRENKRCHT